MNTTTLNHQTDNEQVRPANPCPLLASQAINIETQMEELSIDDIVYLSERPEPEMAEAYFFRRDEPQLKEEPYVQYKGETIAKFLKRAVQSETKFASMRGEMLTVTQVDAILGNGIFYITTWFCNQPAL